MATQTATPSSTSPAPRGDARSKRPALRYEDALQREPSASGPPRSAGSWWTRVGLMVLAAAAVGGGIFLWMSRDQSTGSDKGQNAARESPASGQDESKNKAALRVNVVKPHKGGMARTTTQPGTLHAFQYADLYAKASGYLRTGGRHRRHCREGPAFGRGLRSRASAGGRADGRRGRAGQGRRRAVQGDGDGRRGRGQDGRGERRRAEDRDQPDRRDPAVPREGIHPLHGARPPPGRRPAGRRREARRIRRGQGRRGQGPRLGQGRRGRADPRPGPGPHGQGQFGTRTRRATGRRGSIGPGHDPGPVHAHSFPLYGCGDPAQLSRRRLHPRGHPG